MEKIVVNLNKRSYPIFIGSGFKDNLQLIDDYISTDKVFIITNDTVSKYYLKPITEQLKHYQVSHFIMPDGEKYKNIETFNNILDHLLVSKVERRSTLIALGGGVVGDVAGFAAACCLRGINFIQFPTTLLAQVDSSVGGKTGVNHQCGKNLIGAFYQPSCVIADIETLQTLDKRQFNAGMAEVIKYGILGDIEFFSWIEKNHENIINFDTKALTYLIKKSCLHKADIVSRDEKEQNVRALLNLGHTFGHAIEAGLNYDDWLHGEAISAGMVMAAKMSQAMGDISEDDVRRIIKLFSKFSLPIAPPNTLTKTQMLATMHQDKKVVNGKIQLILLKKLGQAYVCQQFDPNILDQIIAHELPT